MATQQQLMRALNVLVNLTRCVGLKRALTQVDADPKLNFWRVMFGSLLDVAVLEWCKLFGSDAEELHWKNLFQDEAGFRAGLLAQVGLQKANWDAYHDQMKTYRDQHVAHLDFNGHNLVNYPELDHALSSAVYYYSRVIEDLRALGVERFPNSLQDYYDAFLKDSTKIAALANASTHDFKPTVI